MASSPKPVKSRKESRRAPRGRPVNGWIEASDREFFLKIKEFRAIATRYDKTGGSFAAAIYLVAGVIATK